MTLATFFALVAGIRAWQQRDMAQGAAPPLHGILLDGSAYTLPKNPAQPVLVHFWATWCPICRAEQDGIAAIARAYPNTITIAMQSGTETEVTRHLAAQGLTLPVVNDPAGRIARAWGIHAVPASFIIGTDGQIHFIEVGYTTETGLRLRRWFAAIPHNVPYAVINP